MAANGNSSSKSGIKGNKWRLFKTRRLRKSAIPKLWRSRRALLVVLMLASSAAALTSLGVRRAIRPAPSLAPVNASSARSGSSGNLALGKPASQSSTDFGGDASRGVDGNTSGNWGDNSVTHTALEHQPWWQVDLGSVRQIEAVAIWNRTDCCGERLSNFYVLVSDNPFSSTDLTTTINQAGVSSYHTAGLAGTTKEVGVYRSGRYVRVQLAGDNYLQLAEVEVRGVAGSETANPPLRKLREYVYSGGRLVASEEKSCVPTLSPGNASLPQGGGTGSVNVSASSGCTWAASSNASWITVTGGSSGTGNGSVSYSASANGGPQRSGTITVNGQAFNITQAPNPASCSYALNKTSEPVSENGGSGALTLTTGAGCPWTATSNAGWLSVTSAPSGGGSATITYSAAPNGGQQRTGTITVGGQTFTVIQAPNQASCTFALSPSSQAFGVSSGNGSFNITTGAGCHWDAATANGWITITGGATGTSNGTVSFTVQTNNGLSRTGSISVRGQVFTVTQCGYDAYLPLTGEGQYSRSFSSNGGTDQITVKAGAGCSWSATKDSIRPIGDASWIRFVELGLITDHSSVSGSGDSWIDFRILPNPNSGGREGSITVASPLFEWYRTIRITQAGTGQSPSLDPSEADVEPIGLIARYFSNTTLSGQPAIERIDPAVNFNWAGNRPDASLPADSFSVRWSGQLAAPTSEAYTFYLSSDGGARLWVNNQLVIDRWRPPFDPQTRSAPVELKAGEKADVRVEYYNAGGKAAIHLLWSGDSTPKQIIPQRYLYPEAATGKSAPTDTNKQTGILLPPGSDSGPKALKSRLGVASRWLASQLSRTGLAVLIACGLLALLLRINSRRRFTLASTQIFKTVVRGCAARCAEAAVPFRKFRALLSGYAPLVWRSGKLSRSNPGAILLSLEAQGPSPGIKAPPSEGHSRFRTSDGAAAGETRFRLGRVLSRLRDQIAPRIGHFLATPTFKALSQVGAVMGLGKKKLAGLLPERVRAIARRALSLWRGLGLARLKPALRRALVIALIVRLAMPLTPAEAEGLARAAQATWRAMSAYTTAASNRYGASSGSDLINRSIEMALGGRTAKFVSAASQAEQVAELQVCPRQLVMFVGERYTLTPVALNASQQVVHGVGMIWSSLNAAVANASSFGQVEAVAVGNTAVEVQSGAASKQILIEVRSGTRPTGSNQEADIDTSDCAAEQASMFAPQLAAGAQQNLILEDGVVSDEDPLPLANSRATHFKNAVGNPRLITNLGSSNYQFNVPVASVGGRGVSADLDMTFNSRVWNIDDGKLTFNYVGAYPAPGWTMGYGKIIRNFNATATGDRSGVGSGNSPGDYLLVAGDGTRIRLAAKYDAAIGRWLHESDDGSFLQFDPRSGEMRHRDGSRMIYSSVNGCLLPTAMISTNGGAITMNYRDYCQGASCLRGFRHRTALSAVRDTLGRYVTFHYYGDGDYQADAAAGRPEGELAAVKAPDRNGVQQEVIRIEYQPIILKYDFGGIAVDAPANNSPIQVMRRVYYPQTGRGFLFLDYSSYGMPRKISQRMAMTGAGGAITDGVEIAYTTYNYTTIDPNDPYGRNQAESLSDFPQFTHREEWWQGKTDATGAPTTTPTRYDYSRTVNGSTEVTTIKHVDKNFEVVTTTGIDSSQINSGKLISVERKKSEPEEVLSKQVYTYTTGPDGEPEIEKIETFDEAGQGTLVSFGYGPYGRVINRYEYGYKQAGVYQVRRRAHLNYVDDQNYLAARFLRLASRVSVYDAKNNNNDADDELKAKTEITYDDYAAMGGMQSYGLSQSLYPPNHDAAYDQNRVIRGNATAVKTFSSFNPEEATTRRVKYDIFGNVVEAELSCCVKRSFGFSSATAYSSPDWVRVGGATGLNLETNYQYNYFTGLVENETDPDGQPTTYEYDEALRLMKVTNEATDVVAETKFEKDGNGNDLLTYVSQTSYDDQGTQRIITGKQWFDGSGQVIRAGTGTGDAPDSFDMTATVYDGWGRVTKQSNPYRGDANGDPQSGVTLHWTVNTYDELSRIFRVTMPDSQNQFIQTEYNGATVLVTDTVGRKRKGEVDGLGRLVKVTEQNPANGNLEWETSYSYDVLDNLTQTSQGGQLRTFAYDNKGRLRSETTPEAGEITYEYTDFDAVSTRRDARGVITTYTYGPLNLLTGVSYNNVTGVAPTAPVSIFYRDASPGKGEIDRVMDGAGSERYGYDSFGRLQSRTREIDDISYETRYEYNAAGQMTLMIYPSGKRVKAGHDARGRLAALQRVNDSGGVQDTYLSGINYRADGLISSQNLGNGATESFGYSDDRLQLTSQTVTKGANTLLNLNYGYQAGAEEMGNGSKPGNSGQLVGVSGTINGQNRNQAFTYDNVGRLVTAMGWGAWARRFDYDRYGNRTAVWDAVSGGSQLQNTVIEQVNGIKTNRTASVNGTAFSHDAGGNLTGDGARAYTYDAENRVVSVSGLNSESYAYDAGNRRVKKASGGVVTHYIWEGNQVIAEYERGGGATPAKGTRYYHQDRLSTRVITDGAGAVVGTTDQSPFGEEIGGSGEGEKHKFTTYERDNTGLDYAVNRFYSPQQGRFTQADPIGMSAAELVNPQSLNLYAYVENDPINSTDPLGLDGGLPINGFFLGPFPFPTGGGGGGGLRLGPFSFSFSFGGGSFLNFGSLQQSKKKRPAGDNKTGWIGVIVVTPNGTEPDGPSGPGGLGGPGAGGLGGTGPGGLGDDETLDRIQLTLDTLGLIPGIGEAFDLMSAGFSAARGDYTAAALSMAAMIPGFGWGASAAKFARRFSKKAIALGKDIPGGGVKKLADDTGASYYKNWVRDGITRRDPEGRHFGRAFHDAVERADEIHFTLDRIPDVNAAVRAGRRGFIKPTATRAGNMTNAELHYIRHNPHLLRKTTFYRNGKVVPSPW